MSKKMFFYIIFQKSSNFRPDVLYENLVFSQMNANEKIVNTNKLRNYSKKIFLSSM